VSLTIASRHKTDYFWVLMKRLTIILFTVFYASVSMGVDLNLHYCGGKLAKISIALPASSCCCDETKTDSDCCADAQLSLQMDVDQVHMSASDLKFNAPIDQSTAVFESHSSTVFETEEVPQLLPMPPPKRAQQLRVILGSLTFYG